MEYKLNNAEFVLLLIIAEQAAINGYQIRKTVTDRGMEAWAGVSSSSIYVMLKKLEANELVTSKEDSNKRIKGATGQVFTTSPAGISVLTSAVTSSLSTCREHDPRFNIALSALEFIGNDQATSCLKQRHEFLGAEYKRLQDAELDQDNLPVSAHLLFSRIKNGINAELAWLERAISKLEG